MEEDISLQKAEEKKEGKKQNATEKPLSTHPNTETASNKPQQEEQTLEKNPYEIREEAKRGEVGRNKKGEGKEEGIPCYTITVGAKLIKASSTERHIYEVEISGSSDNKERNAREAESKDESSDRSPEKPQEKKESSDKSHSKLQHKERQEKGEESSCSKNEKACIKSKRKLAIEQKDAQLSIGAALPEERTSSSGQNVQMAPQEQPLRYEKDGNEENAFIIRISIRSFSSMMARLNDAQTEAVR
ncbi:hypothetical protein Cgig2_018524 [Carnegiea gigantea]|uniref:Uncharacterized protein n=1 Tax=Carnegiea gigantea TaxID=171969 RepID=A0A9Q1GVE0_9CARY|nr:hypothetical protein Cgig2_018524 [Carnegiea gigantea]